MCRNMGSERWLRTRTGAAGRGEVREGDRSGGFDGGVYGSDLDIVGRTWMNRPQVEELVASRREAVVPAEIDVGKHQFVNPNSSDGHRRT